MAPRRSATRFGRRKFGARSHSCRVRSASYNALFLNRAQNTADGRFTYETFPKSRCMRETKSDSAEEACIVTGSMRLTTNVRKGVRFCCLLDPLAASVQLRADRPPTFVLVMQHAAAFVCTSRLCPPIPRSHGRWKLWCMHAACVLTLLSPCHTQTPQHTKHSSLTSHHTATRCIALTRCLPSVIVADRVEHDALCAIQRRAAEQEAKTRVAVCRNFSVDSFVGTTPLHLARGHRQETEAHWWGGVGGFSPRLAQPGRELSWPGP